jgi:hypothetical protein
MRITIMTLAALLMMAVVALPAAAQTVPGGYDEVGGIIGERPVPRAPAVDEAPAQVQPDVVSPRVVTQAQPGQLAQTGLGLTTGAVLGISLLVLGAAALLMSRRRAGSSPT